MKIVGVQEWLLWTSWFLNALFFSLISFTIITYLLQHEFFGPHSAAIRHVYPSVLWSCIMLFCAANIAFCFMFTALFHKRKFPLIITHFKFYAHYHLLFSLLGVVSALRF